MKNNLLHAVTILMLLLMNSGCREISKTRAVFDVDSCKLQMQQEINELKQLKEQQQITDINYRTRSSALLQKHIDSLLKLAVSDDSVPAAAAGITTSEGDVYVGARGLRKLGREEEVQINDLFHVGSNGKAMTATLIGILVEKGLLSWDSEPEVVLGIDKTSREGGVLTLTHLLTHTGGIPLHIPWRIKYFVRVPKFNEDIQTKRCHFAQWLLPQCNKVGEFLYSNFGYVIAATMAESVTGKSWERLIEEYVFEPLEIDTFIGGWPASADIYQPWGHHDKWWLAEWFSPIGAVYPHPPKGLKLNPLLRPAGDVSMSIPDYMKFLREHLRGLNGESGLLSQEIFEFLHTPMGETRSGCGWGINIDETNSGLTMHGHAGSANTFYMIAHMFPESDFAIAVVANAGSDEAATVCEDLIQAIFTLSIGIGSTITPANNSLNRTT